VLRLRAVLREFFPAALVTFGDLAAGETIEPLAPAPDPDRTARLPRLTIIAALRRAGRRNLEERATTIQQALRHKDLRQPEPVQHAYAAIVSSHVQLINILPGLGPVLGACARPAGRCGRPPRTVGLYCPRVRRLLVALIGRSLNE
jgi:hypothetical protein